MQENENLYKKLYKEVKSMRTAQKLYFQTKDKKFLYSSFDLEKRVDRILDQISINSITEQNIYDKVETPLERDLFAA